MPKAIKIKTTLLALALLLLISLPTFARMLRYGIYPMHDFHTFRLYEFDKCIKDKIFPCRWAPDSGFGYGEPLFNFYPQLPYVIGEIFILSGFAVVTSTKITFILSLFLSSISMFALVLFITKNKFSAILASTLYLYAPYRAVDVWVRGALPESLAFILYPLCVLFFEQHLESGKLKHLIFLSFSLAALFLTHNLSFMMFIMLFIPWILLRTRAEKKAKVLPGLLLTFLLSLAISSFQLFPIISEMKMINIQQTTEGYYDFRAHFVTLRQLFISKAFGFGASVWGPDDNISFSLGHLHWIISIMSLVFAVRVKSKTKKLIVLSLALALISALLTHNKSTFIYLLSPILPQLQFPWRWLAPGAFFFSLAGGFLPLFIKNTKVVILLMAAVVGWNFTFFRPDYWLAISDEEIFSGGRFEEQKASAVNDFWPKFGNATPISTAPSNPLIISGEGIIRNYSRSSHSSLATIDISRNQTTIQFPTVYFPGWKVFTDTRREVTIRPDPYLGLIEVTLDKGIHQLQLTLTNTLPRSLGNLVSLSSLTLALYLLNKCKIHERQSY